MISILQNRKATAAGALAITTAAVATTSVRSRGLSTTAKRLIHIVALGASAVPSTRVLNYGLAFSPKGALYTTDTAPASTAIRANGLAIRADGALHVNSGTPAGKLHAGFYINAERVFVA